MKLRQCFGIFIVLAGLVAMNNRLLTAEQTMWKAGIAKTEITPTQPLWLAGYASRTHPAEGKLHSLWIKALVLESADGQQVVLVTSDLLGLPRDMSERICTELQKRYSLERARIMLTSSHTHCGPVLWEESSGAHLPDIYPLDEKQLSSIKAYSLALEKTIVATVAQALSDLKPVTVWRGQGSSAFAVNRRNNNQNQVAQLRACGETLKGPVDHSVPVLAVRNADGKIRAVIFGYACHGTTLDSYQWCGDYAGFAQINLESSYPDAVALFWQGCGADQNPLPRRSVALCQRYGAMLASAVEEVLHQPMKPLTPQLGTAFEQVDLEIGEVPTYTDLQAAASKGGYQEHWAKRLMKQLEENKTFDKSYPYPVQVWKLGAEQLWISLGSEVVVDYANIFKSKYGNSTWVTSYANSVMAYIPSHRVWEEGGYEAGAFEAYGLAAKRWAPDIEEKVTTSVDRLVGKLALDQLKPTN
ncbi:MAG: neutral/alkaline non-lysosomal ceramidase N-terminal domain-containing protein [Sedimentisphaerales bacterium]|nr:neutral/alkaline non-lysosomal ceramidase N-terminal domain-containing protein [Sedimentisphaerales bacterium]